MIRQYIIGVPTQLNRGRWYMIGLLGLKLHGKLLGAFDHFCVGVGAVVSGCEAELAQVDVVCRVWGNQAAWHDFLEWKLAWGGMREHLETKMQAFFSWRFQGELIQGVLSHGRFAFILRLGQGFGKKMFALGQLSLCYFFFDQLQP